MTASGTTPLFYQWRKNGVPIFASTYSFVGGNTSWSNAKTDAESRGGHLATITSATEWAEVASQLGSNKGKIMWLGGFQLTGTSNPSANWRWITGEEFGYLSWGVGEPNGGNGSNSFLHANHVAWPTAYGNWNDVGATEGIIEGYLLEVEPTTSPSLVLNAVQVLDAGTYDVVIFNGLGSSTSVPVILTVNTLPSIVTQPASATVLAGTSASFSVIATGAGTLSYQWRKDGTNINGGTLAMYTIASARLAAAGSYDVLVSSVSGSVISNTATLTVNSPFVVQVPTSPYGASLFRGSNAFQPASIVRVGDDGTSSWSYALRASSGTGAAVASGTLGQDVQLSVPLRAVTASGEYVVRVTRTSANGALTIVDSSPFRINVRTWADAAGSYEVMLEDDNGAIGDRAHYRGKVTATLNSTGAFSGRLLYNAAPHLEAVNVALSPEWSIRSYAPVVRAFAGAFVTGADGEPQVVRVPRTGMVVTGSQVLTLSVDFSTTPLQFKAAVQDYESVPMSSFPSGATSSGSSSAVLTNLGAVLLAGGTQVVNLSGVASTRYALASDAVGGGSLGASRDNNAYLLAQALPSGNLLWATRMTGYSGSGAGVLRLRDVAGGSSLAAAFYEAQSSSSAALLQTTSLLGELQLNKNGSTGEWTLRMRNGELEDSLERQCSYLGKGLVNGKVVPVHNAAVFNVGNRPVARDANWSGVSEVKFGDRNATAWNLAKGVFGAMPVLLRQEHYLAALDPLSGGKYIWRLSISNTGVVRTWKHVPGDASQPVLGVILDRARGEFLGGYTGLDGVRRNLRGVVLPRVDSRDPSAQGWLETGVLPGMQSGGWWLSE